MAGCGSLGANSRDLETGCQRAGTEVRLHHVGIAVQAIDGIGRAAMEQLRLRPLTPVYADPLQRVKVQFWGDESGSTCIELVEPDGADSPVTRAVEKGGGLNHLCYEVENIETVRAEALRQGAVCVVAPVPAVAFEGRLITFVFFRGIGLVEYLQAPASQNE